MERNCTDDLIAEKDEVIAAKDKIIAEKDTRLAEMMIKDGEPVEKTERYTGLDIDALKQIAISLGEYVYVFLADKATRGSDTMLHNEAMLWSDRIVAETVERVRAEDLNRLAKMMVIDEKPIDEIERYTGLNVDTLKLIAKSLGKTLVI